MSKDQSKNKSQAEQKDNMRRRALKSTLLVGGIVGSSTALPAKWTRPIIDNVILPSHAQTTTPAAANLGTEEKPEPTPTINYFYDNTNTDLVSSPPGARRNIAERVLETMIPSASAIQAAVTRYYICMAITGNTYTAKILAFRYGYLYDEYDGITGTVDVQSTHSMTTQYCNGSGGSPDINLIVSNVSAASCQCDISQQFEDDTSIIVPVGNCAAVNTSCK